MCPMQKGHSCNKVDSFPQLIPNSRLCDKEGQEPCLSITQSKVKHAPCQTVISRQFTVFDISRKYNLLW